MKIKYITVLVACILSILCGTIYMKFFSNEEISIYVCQVGVYSSQDNANKMIQKLQTAKLPNYVYQKDKNWIVISDIFLSEKEASAFGKTISEKEMTCAIVAYSFPSDMQSLVVDKNYDGILKELEK